MNFNVLLNEAKEFAKLARINPFRNSEHDIEEALDYSRDFIKLKNGQDLMDLPFDWLELEYISDFPVKNLYDYDDIDSWIELRPGELKQKSKNEKIEFFKRLRGKHAIKWLEDGIPAVVLIDFPEFKALGDGRGRVNFAVGMNYSTVPVVIVKLKENHWNDVEYLE